VAGVDWALILCGLVVLATQPHRFDGDAGVRLAMVDRMLDGRSPGDTPYSVISPVLSLPFRAVGAPGLFNVTLFAVSLAVLWALLRGRVAADLVRRFLLLLVAASMIAPHTGSFNSEVFTAFCVGAGIVVAALPRRQGWSVAPLALGVANTPATAVGLGLVSLDLVIRSRRLRWLLPVLAAGALVAVEAWVRRGSPFDGGYGADHGFRTVMPYSGRSGFSYPFVLGVLAILFSFGRGLLFFAPGLFLPTRLSGRYDPSRVDLVAVRRGWLLFTAGLVVVYASWWAWYGGASWGPRFFLFASLPAALALAVRLGPSPAPVLGDLATLAALLLSGWVAVAGRLFAGLYPPVCAADSYRLEALCWFTPEYSSLWYPLWAGGSLSAGDWLVVAYHVVAVGWLARSAVSRLSAAIPRVPVRGWRL